MHLFIQKGGRGGGEREGKEKEKEKKALSHVTQKSREEFYISTKLNSNIQCHHNFCLLAMASPVLIAFLGQFPTPKF